MDKQTTETTKTEPEVVQVLVRFERTEIEEMKRETGANADATAIACYCRKNLRKG